MMDTRKPVLGWVSTIIQNDIETIPLDAVLVHPKLIFFGFKVPFKRGRLAPFDQCLVYNLARCSVVQLHVQRRNRQCLPNVVKTARRRVIRKAVRRLEIYSH